MVTSTAPVTDTTYTDDLPSIDAIADIPGAIYTKVASLSTLSDGAAVGLDEHVLELSDIKIGLYYIDVDA